MRPLSFFAGFRDRPDYARIELCFAEFISITVRRRPSTPELRQR